MNELKRILKIIEEKFNKLEIILLGASIFSFIGKFMNLYTGESIYGYSEKMGSLFQAGGFFYLIPIVLLIISVFLHLEQVSLVLAIVEGVLMGYGVIFLPVNQFETMSLWVTKGAGWYVITFSTIVIIAVAVLNAVKSKKENK